MNGQGPWTVMRFDPTGDDNRGESHEYGNYRSKDKAQALVDKRNQVLLVEKNRDKHRRWKLSHHVWETSLKIDPEPVYEPVPLTTKGHGWTRDEYFYLEEMEFDDDND